MGLHGKCSDDIASLFLLLRALSPSVDSNMLLHSDEMQTSGKSKPKATNEIVDKSKRKLDIGTRLSNYDKSLFNDDQTSVDTDANFGEFGELEVIDSQTDIVNALFAVEHLCDVVELRYQRGMSGCRAGTTAATTTPSPGSSIGERDYRRAVSLSCCSTALAWAVAGYYMATFLDRVSTK